MNAIDCGMIALMRDESQYLRLRSLVNPLVVLDTGPSTTLNSVCLRKFTVFVFDSLFDGTAAFSNESVLDKRLSFTKFLRKILEFRL